MRSSKKHPKKNRAAQPKLAPEAKPATEETTEREGAEPREEEPAESPPAGLMPVIPANSLHGGTSRVWIGPYARWADNCLEIVCDRARLESNVRAVRFGLTSSANEEIVFTHNAGEKPVAVVLSALSIPAGLTEDLKIEPILVDANVIKMSVFPPEKGIGVGITALFQTAGQSAEV